MGEDRYTYELKALGQRFKQLRRKKGLSQLDIEANCGINRTEISRIENGLKNIEFYTLVRLAEVLDVALYEFFQPSEEDKRNR